MKSYYHIELENQRHWKNNKITHSNIIINNSNRLIPGSINLSDYLPQNFYQIHKHVFVKTYNNFSWDIYVDGEYENFSVASPEFINILQTFVDLQKIN